MTIVLHVYLLMPLCIVDVHCGKNDNKAIYLEQTITMHDLKPTLSNDINSHIDTQTLIMLNSNMVLQVSRLTTLCVLPIWVVKIPRQLVKL